MKLPKPQIKYEHDLSKILTLVAKNENNRFLKPFLDDFFAIFMSVLRYQI
jgi:hypothetical protein